MSIPGYTVYKLSECTLLGRGSYNSAYRAPDGRVVKVAHRNYTAEQLARDYSLATDLPERSVRVWNETNADPSMQANLCRVIDDTG